MKITAEFESIEEIIEFTNKFGKVDSIAQTVERKEESKKEEPKSDKPKVETPKEEKSKKEEPKITKEMVREVCARAMKAGKQAEVKKIISDHGASKLPELKEEEYAAVVAEVEAL